MRLLFFNQVGRQILGTNAELFENCFESLGWMIFQVRVLLVVVKRGVGQGRVLMGGQLRGILRWHENLCLLVMSHHLNGSRTNVFTVRW